MLDDYILPVWRGDREALVVLEYGTNRRTEGGLLAHIEAYYNPAFLRSNARLAAEAVRFLNDRRWEPPCT